MLGRMLALAMIFAAGITCGWAYSDPSPFSVGVSVVNVLVALSWIIEESR